MTDKRSGKLAVKSPAKAAAAARTEAAASPARKKVNAPVVPRSAQSARPAQASAKVAKSPAAPKARDGLLRAGLRALGDVRDGVVQRQTRVVETLLGLPQPRASGRSAPEPSQVSRASFDPLGFRKIEDVFDQRIAAALERLGVPSAAQFEALQRQLDQLTGKPAVGAESGSGKLAKPGKPRSDKR